MSKEQTPEEKRKEDALRLREWRARKRAEYIANGGEPPKRGRPTVSAEAQKEKKKLREAKYREQKRLAAPPKPPKQKAAPKPKKRTKKAEPPPPPLQEVLPPEDAEWRAPAVCEILAASKSFEDCRKFATIEQRKPAHRPLRLKIVIFGSSIAELKREAAKVGINSFWNYGHVK